MHARIANINFENVDSMLESHALLWFTTHHQYAIQEVQDLIKGARADLRKSDMRLYMPLYVAVARRPSA